MRRYPCGFCGRETAADPHEWCRVCQTHVTCGQCGGAHLAPPEIGVCERCRYRNVTELRQLHAIATAVAALDLAELPGRVVYPFRSPLDSLEAARLARAALELQAAARAVLGLAELRASQRKGPKRATAAQEGGRRWKKRSG